MAKAVFFAIPAHGHINPTLPIVTGLVARGEKVIYYATPVFAGKIASTGAEVRILTTPFDGLIEDAAMTIGRNAFAIAAKLLEASMELIGRVSEEVRREKPDYIVHDAIAIYGRVVSQLLGVPALSTIPSPCWGQGHLADVPSWFALDILRQGLFAFPEIVRYYALSRRLRLKYGLNFGWPLRVFFSYEEMSIVTTSRLLQQNADKLDPRKFIIVGPMLARTEEGSFVNEGGGDVELVYVSMGTVYNRDRGFFNECFKALGESGYRVLVSTGAAVDPGSLGEAPPNFTLAPSVPQMRVLGSAAVFVSHGGMNSLNEALYHGVPMVLVPRALDQFINSRRIAELGAGIYVKRPNAANLRRAVDLVMNEPEYRSAARRLSGEIRAEAGIERALAAIEGFKRTHGIG
jgi:MGT family glycosyltransferase